MFRWHSSNCRRPDVVLAGNTPYCGSCDTFADLVHVPEYQPSDESISTRAVTTSMELRWPSSVTYSRKLNASQKTETLGPFNSPIRQIPESLGRKASLERLSAKQRRTDQKEDQAVPNDGYCQLQQKYEFRLLYLPQSSGDTPLHGRLEVADLMDAPSYEALSYTWADEDGNSDRCEIAFFGAYWDCLRITRNCYLALQHLRTTRFLTIWVDAICINQNSVSERSHQVSIMRDIFSKANSVTVYLGRSNGAMDELAEDWFDAFDDETEVLSSIDINPLFKKRYFTRVWVIQEIAVARKISLVYGDHYLDWRLCTRMRGRPEWLRHYGQEDSAKLHQPAKLLDLLDKTSSSSATDARDQVFGILGLLSSSVLRGLVPDYSLSIEEVYTGIASYLILKNRNVEILAYPKSSNIQSLPSWVPDWTITRSKSILNSAPLGTAVDFDGTAWISGRDTLCILLEWFDVGQPRVSLTRLENPARRSRLYGHPRVSFQNGALQIAAWSILEFLEFAHTDSFDFTLPVTSSAGFRWIVRTEQPVDMFHDEVLYIPGCRPYLHVRKHGLGNHYKLIGTCSVGFQCRQLRPTLDISSRGYVHTTDAAQAPVSRFEKDDIDPKMMGAFYGVNYSLIILMEEHLLKGRCGHLVQSQFGSVDAITASQELTQPIDHPDGRSEEYLMGCDYWDTTNGWQATSWEPRPKSEIEGVLQRLTAWQKTELWQMVDKLDCCLTELRSMLLNWGEWCRMRLHLNTELESSKRAVQGPSTYTIQLAIGPRKWCNTGLTPLQDAKQAWRQLTYKLIDQIQATSVIQYPPLAPAEEPWLPAIPNSVTENTIGQWLQDDLRSHFQQFSPPAEFGQDWTSYDFSSVVRSRIAFLDWIEPSWQDFKAVSANLRDVCRCLENFRTFQDGITSLGDIIIM
ncbi:heterokaryon incompatibility protein-domain-containing protein [Xylariaceae sp. AK1471]|nr:heterokaryon incompatibility protein-domain-containing protein [Xylariaceae sp. AK1471]